VTPKLSQQLVIQALKKLTNVESNSAAVTYFGNFYKRISRKMDIAFSTLELLPVWLTRT